MKTYAVIGDPISHSISPAIHNAAFRAEAMDCIYMAYRVPRGELQEGVQSLVESGMRGFNVTIPHKVGIMEYLDYTDPACSTAGAANTVSIENGRLAGYNTDMGGFLEPILSRNMKTNGMDILIMGSGGAARAAAASLCGAGPRHIRILARNIENARDIESMCKSLGIDAGSGVLPTRLLHHYDMVVNATSAGMGGGAFPVDIAGGVSEETLVYDIVYTPIETDIIKQAKKAGARVVYGWEMLLAQAAAAFEIWHGREAPLKAMRAALLGGF